jgi:hypothetical protein
MPSTPCLPCRLCCRLQLCRRLARFFDGIYDGANPVQELSGSTVTANLLTGLGVDERFTRTDSSATANFLTDALGSTLALTDGGVSTLASYTYEPFGNATMSGGSTSTYQYTGRAIRTILRDAWRRR